MIKIIAFVITSCLIKEAFLWPNHDISSLKLLQVVHRHGDRTPTEFVGNDPFSDLNKYWPEGEGELTNEGRLRLYKLGQFIRREYNQFLGEDYSPREVYVRSSLSHRCLDSASLLLSGAYPPNNMKWQWSSNNGTDDKLGSLWQPFPIESFMPKDDDIVMTVDRNCPTAEEELKKILNSETVLKLLDENKDFFDELSEKVGHKVNDLKTINKLYEALVIERNRDLKWSDMKVWTPDYEQMVINKLKPFVVTYWRLEWDNRLIERVRAGPLVEKLLKNFGSYIEGKPIENSVRNPYKMFVYSTHDSKLAVLMNALNIFNDQLIPFGATLLFELHQTPGAVDYFVKIYYFNETLSDLSPHPMSLKDCDNRVDCPFNRFMEISKNVIPDNWERECGVSSSKQSIFISNLVAMVLNIILLLVLVSLIIFNCYHNNRSSYIPLE